MSLFVCPTQGVSPNRRFRISIPETCVPHFLDARETIHALYNDHVREAAR
jgi:hypothetical protein